MVDVVDIVFRFQDFFKGLVIIGILWFFLWEMELVQMCCADFYEIDLKLNEFIRIFQKRRQNDQNGTIFPIFKNPK